MLKTLKYKLKIKKKKCDVKKSIFPYFYIYFMVHDY